MRPEDRVDFIVEDGEVRLVRKESRIEATFGICQTERFLGVEELAPARAARWRSGPRSGGGPPCPRG